MYQTDLNTPKVELEQRVINFQKYLKKENVDAALISQRADLFYFAGTIQQANLFIPADGEPILMVYKSTERAKAESSIEQIVHLNSPKEVPDILKANGHAAPLHLGLELDVLPTNMFFSYQRLFQGTILIDISHFIRLIRSVKSEYELKIMRQAARLSDQVVLRNGYHQQKKVTLDQNTARPSIHLHNV